MHRSASGDTFPESKNLIEHHPQANVDDPSFPKQLVKAKLERNSSDPGVYN